MLARWAATFGLRPFFHAPAPTPDSMPFADAGRFSRDGACDPPVPVVYYNRQEGEHEAYPIRAERPGDV